MRHVQSVRRSHLSAQLACAPRGLSHRKPEPRARPELRRYLTDEIGPSLAELGFTWNLWENPVAGAPSMLFAERIEDRLATTMLTYGHGDVVLGYDAQWTKAGSPWVLEEQGNRWYGRGTADNKGQHSSSSRRSPRYLPRAERSALTSSA